MRNWFHRRAGRSLARQWRTTALRLERLEDRWVPAFIATLSGTTATFTGDASGDLLTFDVSGGMLKHNRATLGDPGFNSDFDFDSTQPGDQTLPAAAASTVTVNAGDGNDTVSLGAGTAPASAIDGRFVVNGEGGTDSVIWDDSKDATGRAINVQGGSSNQVFIPSTGASVGFGSTNEAVTVLAGQGNDTISVSQPGLTDVSVNAGGGDDTVAFANGATLGGGLDGGTGNNTLDYSAYTTPVDVSLGADVALRAAVTGSQQVPPVSTTASGTAFLLFDPAAGTFDFSSDVQGITLANLTESHLHSGAAGTNGGVIFDFHAPDTWKDFGTSLQLVQAGAPGAVFPAAEVSNLLAGNIYFNVHTTAFASGEIRGQLQVAAAGNSATGVSGLANFDSVVGGSGDDTLVGNGNANTISGGGGNDLIFGLGGTDTLTGGTGNDTITGGAGNDTINGDAGDDRLIWNNGDGTDVMEGGAGHDTVEVNGSNGADGDNFTVSANGPRLRVERTNLGPFSLDIGSTEALSLSGGAGDDTLTVNNLTGVRDLTAVQLFGLEGNDTLDTSALPVGLVTVTAVGGAGDNTIRGVSQGVSMAAGAGPGGSPQVVLFNPDGSVLRTFMAYDPAFTGGVRVAVGDVNGDGIPDIITGAGPGGGPHVKVFDGQTGQELASFFAYDPAFSGGVFVAAGDVNGDGKADIITGAGPGGGPHVKVFDGATGAMLQSFFAYDPAFTGGVSVAAGDVTGNGTIDIITGAGPGGGPHVKVFDPSGAMLQSFFAYDPAFTGGAFVAAADMNGDGKADIITGAGPGGSPHMRAFSGDTGTDIASFFAYDPTFSGGVYVG